MNRRLSVRLPEGLGWAIEAFAQRSGMTKSGIVRDALIKAGIGIPSSPEVRREVLRRMTDAPAQPGEMVDAVALIRESREELDQRGEAAASAGPATRCRGRREPPTGRTTPGFQQIP